MNEHLGVFVKRALRKHRLGQCLQRIGRPRARQPKEIDGQGPRGATKSRRTRLRLHENAVGSDDFVQKEIAWTLPAGRPARYLPPFPETDSGANRANKPQSLRASGKPFPRFWHLCQEALFPFVEITVLSIFLAFVVGTPSGRSDLRQSIISDDLIDVMF